MLPLAIKLRGYSGIQQFGMPYAQSTNSPSFLFTQDYFMNCIWYLELLSCFQIPIIQSTFHLGYKHSEIYPKKRKKMLWLLKFYFRHTQL